MNTNNAERLEVDRHNATQRLEYTGSDKARRDEAFRYHLEHSLRTGGGPLIRRSIGMFGSQVVVLRAYRNGHYSISTGTDWQYEWELLHFWDAKRAGHPVSQYAEYPNVSHEVNFCDDQDLMAELKSRSWIAAHIDYYRKQLEGGLNSPLILRALDRKVLPPWEPWTPERKPVPYVFMPSGPIYVS